jgi:hypothetical protein
MPCGAGRAAIDARRKHPGYERSVKRAIAPLHRLPAGLVIHLRKSIASGHAAFLDDDAPQRFPHLAIKPQAHMIA